MTGAVLRTQAERFSRKVPEIKPGYTVRVHERIQEGGKERVQIFEGLVISVHAGHVPTDASFTVRKIVSGVGVEKVFPLMGPTIEKIDVKKVAKVRRAKLFFIRGRSGKSARMSERFTTEGEFAVEDDEPVVPQEGDVSTNDTAEAAAPTEEVAAEAPVATQEEASAAEKKEEPTA